jgi:predicted acetyltransferase
MLTHGLTLRSIEPGEYDRFHRFVEAVFLSTPRPEDVADELQVFESDRSSVVFDGAEIVGSSAILTRDLTVPGGPTPSACVTAVAVAPTHRRRGVLTEMMRTQLHGLHGEGREPLATLWASEAAIYGRFGYGMANLQAHLQADIRLLALRPDVARGPGEVRLGDPGEVRDDLVTVYERVRPERVGHFGRPDRWWNRRLYFPEHRRHGAGELRAAVHHGPDGPDAYALYAPKPGWADDGPDGGLTIRELTATTPEAHAALWELLLGIDLARTLDWNLAPVDTPLLHQVTDAGRVRVTTSHGLWVRLVDLDRALGARRYAAPVDVVFEVSDEFCPWNAGRWRLTAGPGAPATCERTGSPADLALSAAELGAAYLGGTSLGALAAAGRVRELCPGAVRAASTAFAEPRAPHCPEIF